MLPVTHRIITSHAAAAAAAAATAIVLFTTFAGPRAAHAQTTRPTAATTVPATNPAEVEAEIDALLKQLASDDWPVRMAAQNRLAALGELAEARLKRAAGESDDAEVRARSEAALHQIDENRMSGPTLITMSVFNVNPQIVFGEIGRQVGTEFKPQNPSLWSPQMPAVTLDVRREPLWDVIRRVREQCGLDVEPGPGGWTVVQIPPGQDKAPTVTSGPFRVRATRIARSYAVDLTSGGLAQNDFVVHLSLQAEPKLKISRAASVAKLEAAEDENQLSLLPGAGPGAGAGAAGGGAPAGGPAVAPLPALALQNAALVRARADVGMRQDVFAWPLAARLEYPAEGAGKRIARLTGSAACSVIVRTETIEVPDVLNAANITQQAGGTSLTVRNCRKLGEQYEVLLTVSGDAVAAGPQVFMQRGPRASNQGMIRLVDGTDRELVQQGMPRISSMNNGRMDLTLKFAAQAPLMVASPLKLTWQVPAEVREVDVPFEFIDLPLP